jgi:hypothetical protein
MGVVSNRKPASVGISPEVQGRLPYFIDESQRILITADAGFLWIKLARSLHNGRNTIKYNTWNAVWE